LLTCQPFSNFQKTKVACFFKLCLMLIFFENPLMADVLNSFNQWKILLTGPASVHGIMAFLKEHPKWPSQERLQEKLETNLTGLEPGLIEWFQQFPPITPEGALVYGRILLDKGKHEETKALAQKFWQEYAFQGPLAKTFRAAFSDFLCTDDDFRRANRFLYDGNIPLAEELLPNLPPVQQDIIKSRIALIRSEKNALKQAEDTLSCTGNPPSIIFNLVNYYRNQKTDSGNATCIKLLSSPSIAEEESQYPEKWWNERNILARRMIEEKKYDLAAQLIENHKLTKGEQFANAEWILGWLYVRYLNRPLEAKDRFQRLYEKVGSPISKARVAFWMGETLKILGDDANSIQWYEKAAQHPLAFYGQLAMSRLRARGKNIAMPNVQKTQASAAIKKQFENRDFVHLLKNICKTEADEFVLPFFLNLADSISDPVEQSLLVEFTLNHGNAYKAVLVCKKVSRSQIPATPACFPELKKSTYNAVAKISPDVFVRTLVHAIIRQESRFDSNATSTANAMGLMQVIAKTAQEEVARAKSYGISVAPKQSIYNEQKNVTLGTFHILHLLKKHEGSLILAMGNYNAGPVAIGNWLELFGNPHNTTSDIIDWLENIPFGETRNYIQRVMENFMVYNFLFTGNTQTDLVALLTHRQETAFLKTKTSPSTSTKRGKS
jgi:soluble lytic murein transglycosylase